MKIFITGIAGMIGYHAAKTLHEAGHQVVGIDNFNSYYDVNLKKHRARMLKENYGIEISYDNLEVVKWNPLLRGSDVVLHLAAYANPRHSMEFPQLYIDTNITGTQRLIEACAASGIEQVVYASSSCVCHGQPLPWNETDLPTHQNNPYGWSKRVNECQFMSSKIKSTTGLRFFTVYGPFGRPDMALFIFTNNIAKGLPITMYNYGNMIRDFTYVDDIVQGINIAIDHNSKHDGHELFNIGRGEQVNLMDFVKHIEHNLGKKAILDLVPAHPADVPATWADTTRLQALGYNPQTSIEEGVNKFVDWYKTYYGI